jgi:hypothetical protein
MVHLSRAASAARYSFRAYNKRKRLKCSVTPSTHMRTRTRTHTHRDDCTTLTYTIRVIVNELLRTENGSCNAPI